MHDSVVSFAEHKGVTPPPSPPDDATTTVRRDRTETSAEMEAYINSLDPAAKATVQTGEGCGHSVLWGFPVRVETATADGVTVTSAAIQAGFERALNLAHFLWRAWKRFGMDDRLQ
eukprot:1427678-Rhodomonas_salina.1